jgi:mRNA interferase MazF
MRRGDVWWAEFPDPWGIRPAVLLARDDAYSLLTWIMVAPVTTTVRGVPTVVVLNPEDDGVPRHSAVSLDHVQSIRKDWLVDYLVHLGSARMREIDRAIHFALALRACP